MYSSVWDTLDHFCSSEQCVSHRIAAMCREASWKISEDLCNDQPLDACGYIAADAVCRLREAALAEGVRFRHEFPTPEGFANATTAAFDGDGALLVVAYAREGENGGEGEARAWARVERNTSINRRPS